MEIHMRIIGFIVFFVLEILFIPLSIIGFFIIATKPKRVSRKLGVSSTAVSVIANRWMMHVFGRRADWPSVKLFAALPNSPVWGMRLVFFPTYVAYKIAGDMRGIPSKTEEGMETLKNVGIARDTWFDAMIEKSKDAVEQAVILGAGYDTRCYGMLKTGGVRLFELDQPATQRLKRQCLDEAGIDAAHVTFVSVDFTTDEWFDRLAGAGFDPGRKTIFIWQGVTLYLSEREVRNTLKKIRSRCAPGCAVLVDFYDPTKMGYLRSIQTAGEKFDFGLDLGIKREEHLRAFVESEGLRLGAFHFMGHRTEKGAFGAVAEVRV
jgi:methyltransferase (TIGR00027 family)